MTKPGANRKNWVRHRFAATADTIMLREEGLFQYAKQLDCAASKYSAKSRFSIARLLYQWLSVRDAFHLCCRVRHLAAAIAPFPCAFAKECLTLIKTATIKARQDDTMHEAIVSAVHTATKQNTAARSFSRHRFTNPADRSLYQQQFF